MVTRTNNKWLKRIARWRRGPTPFKITVLLILMLISTVSSMKAGDLKNNGTITNTGTIRVKSNAQGLPLVNTGVYEFFGGNQTIPARQYADLKISNGGVKTISSGMVAVYGTLDISPVSTLVAAPGASIDLHGTLNEQGYFQGEIDRSDNLAGISGSSTFGNIGTTISWTGTAPGNTTVLRSSGVALTSPQTGNESIKRYYDIAPTFPSNLNGTLVFKYADVELNSQDENTLSLWRSPDGGATWRKQGGVVDPTLNTITKTGVVNFSRWTASDATHPLSPVTSVEWVARSLALTSGNSQSALANATLPSPFVVTVTDDYGNPIAGTGVTFAIASAPGGASGQSLSATTVTTAANGQASTFLKLGSAAGSYTVTATSGSLTGSPVTFTATAATFLPPPLATSMVLTAGTNQVDTVGRQLASPLVVTVLNQFGGPISGTTVNFTVGTVPSGATGQVLTTDSVTTNASGEASTGFKLGSKPGTYTVVATSPTLSGVVITFTFTALTDRAALLASTSGNGQMQNVKTVLAQPFIVTVTDQYANPVSGANVRFTITRAPLGASGQRLTDTSVTTGSTGQATTVMTLGDSVGVYEVTATSGSLQGSPVTFTVNATRPVAVPSRIILTAGNNQVGQVNATLASPMIATVTDSSNNPVAGVPVTFAISSVPDGAMGQRLSVTSAVTDVNGRAASVLTLGSVAGSYIVTASSGSLTGSPVVFTATATGAAAPPRLVLTAGNNQSGTVNTALQSPMVVSVLDSSNNPVAGKLVTFAISSAPTGATGQRLSDTSVVTGANGQASTVLTLGNLAGAYIVTASASVAGSPITFAATATSASRIVYTFGSDQSAPILSTPTSPLTVTALNASGAPVQGATVIFAVDSIPFGATGQDVLLRSVTTDALGRASTSVKLGSKIGIYKFTASSAGLNGSPITFRLTATTGPAANIVTLAGDRQMRPVLATLDSAFVVRITDAGGNPVSGMPVQFAIESAPSLATGQSLAVIKPVTDAFGEASARLTLGSKAGEYVVSATAAGLPGVRFATQAVLGAPASMALVLGNNQIGYVPFELDQPFVVSIVDVGGNVLPGVAVQFAIVSKPAGVLGERLSATSVTTDAAGRASTILKLGDKIGVYAVQATTPSVPGLSVVFTASGTLLIGDVNTDKETNIADLTSVIDHVLGRITLSDNDSVKADMDRNGVINILDVIAIRDNLLTIALGATGAENVSASAAGDGSRFQNVSFASDTLADVRGEFVLTESGLRFNMTNKVPVKGLQLIVRLKNPVSITGPDAIYQRAQKHAFFVNTSGTEMRIVAYNAQNIPIAPDSGALFRLPLRLSDVAEIISGQVIVSTTDELAQVDQALKGQAFKRLLDPNIDTIPYSFTLHQNYPNPFNAQTKIEYEVPDVPERTLRVVIQVYNVSGEKVKTLIAANQAAGRYSVTWDATDDIGRKVPSGTYYYRLVSGSFQSAKKMILLK